MNLNLTLRTLPILPNRALLLTILTKQRREGDLNPRGPERPQAAWCLPVQTSPGLLPAWLGDPGK